MIFLSQTAVIKVSSDIQFAKILVKLACVRIFFPKDTAKVGSILKICVQAVNIELGNNLHRVSSKFYFELLVRKCCKLVSLIATNMSIDKTIFGSI